MSLLLGAPGEYQKLPIPCSLRSLRIRESGSQLWVLGSQGPPRSRSCGAFSRELTEQERGSESGDVHGQFIRHIQRPAKM